MSYYQRPMGDYKTYGYAGDPGFLSGLWKGIKKIAGPVIGGLIGGPVGAVIGGLGGAKQAPAGIPVPHMPGQPSPWMMGGAVSFPGGVSVSGALVPGQGRLPPYTAAGPGVIPGGGRGGAGVPSGYHFAKDGSGRLVRNRRMNIANPRALRRAIRRTDGFVKLAKRALKGTGYAVRRA